MPYKEKVISYMDKISKEAVAIKSVNTILNSQNKLIGFNTDFDSVIWALKKLHLSKNTKVLLLGFGGMAKTFLEGLRKINLQDVYIATRKPLKSKILNIVKWKHRHDIDPDLLINATPIGMKNTKSEMIINLNKQKNLKYLIDVVSNPTNTKITQKAIKKRIVTIKGVELALMQAKRQFEIYTNRTAPIEIMKKKLLNLNKYEK